MMSLLSLYSTTIIASACLAAALALLGVQLAARDRAMQSLCVGQGAMLGVLCGIGVLGFLANASAFAADALPFTLGVLAAAATFYASSWWTTHRGASRNTHFAALFVLLLSAGHLVSALLPGLETHMAQKFFGDLATMSETTAKVSLAFGIGLGCVLARYWRRITADSFATAIFGAAVDQRGRGRLFNLAALVAICFSVQMVGFLFTVASLFLPTAILARGRLVGLRQHAFLASASAALGAAGGFMWSLYHARLPTVPTIVLVTAVLGVSINGLGAKFARPPQR